MTTQRLALSAALLGLTGSFVTGCIGDGGDGPPADPGASARTRGTLPGFESEAEFEAYMKGLEPVDDPSAGGIAADAGVSDDFGEAAGGAAGGADGAAPPNENITNTQEADIDEGGIVKNIGRFLVVLRHGRVHVMDTQAEGGAQQVDVAGVAPAEALDFGVWYDEMLVSGRDLVVVGYRYASEVLDEREQPMPWIYGATEMTRFSVSDDGHLTRGASTWLESNDYYSGTNYASRLVNDEVLLYMPYGAFVWGAGSGGEREIHRPRNLEYVGDGRFVARGEIFDWSQVVHGEVAPGWPVFHTVLRCPLSQVEGLAGGCQGKSLLADGGATMYVSANAVYLWGDQVARLDLNDGSAALHAAGGYPTDQFAFKDTGDALHAVVVTQGPVVPAEPADEPEPVVGEDWTPPPSTLRHLILPIGDFDAQGAQPIAEVRQPVVGDITNAWVERQKYLGDRFVAAATEWLPNGSVRSRVLLQSMDGRVTHELSVAGPVTRIESLGALGALLVWNDAQAGMHLDVLPAVEGNAAPVLRPGFTVEQAAEGESRSHGFFYKAQPEGGGLFGLSVVGEWASPEAWYGAGVSNLAFFHAAADGVITPAGHVSAGMGEAVACEVSCVDWYGNTRPIFLGDRIFALMGDELAELTRAADGSLVETGARGHLRAE